MTLREACAFKLLPLIARIVLFAAFFPMGWQQIFSSVHCTASDAATLASIGITAEGIDWTTVQSTGFGSMQTGATPPGNATLPPEAFSGRTLYQSALLAHTAGVPYPAIAAWLAALAQLAGAVLLFLGAFSRLSAIALALVLGGAFWMISLPALQQTGWWTMPHDDHLKICAQVSLFVLALMVALLGSGSLSVDGMLGSSSKPRSSAGSTAPRKDIKQ